MPELLIPKPLRHQARIHKDVVAAYRHLPTCLMCEESAEKVAKIAETPFDEEEDGEARGAGDAIVLVDLRQLGEEPGTDG